MPLLAYFVLGCRHTDAFYSYVVAPSLLLCRNHCLLQSMNDNFFQPMTPLAKIKMVSLPFDDVGLLPYRKPTNQSLTLTQPINESTNHKPTNHMSTNPNTTNHVSTNPNLPVTSQQITSQPIKINRSHIDQPPHSQTTAVHGPALFCQVAVASDVGSAKDIFTVSTYFGKSSARGRPLEAGNMFLGYDLR